MVEQVTANNTTYAPSLLRICIDQIADGKMQGRIIGVAVPEIVFFRGMAEFTCKIDELYNKIGNPQAFQVMRSFAKEDDYNSFKGSPNIYHSAAEINRYCGQVVTFHMIMTSRTGAEWQGILKNIDGEIINHYKTVLECINAVENFCKAL